MNHSVKIKNEQETQDFARKICSILSAGDILCLKGDLGAGKTFLVKEMISHLANIPVSEITSPTFQIMQSYDIENKRQIHHYDLYRLKSPHEIYEVGFEDSLSHAYLTIIEWPEIIEEMLPKSILEIDIKIDGVSRIFKPNNKLGAILI